MSDLWLQFILTLDATLRVATPLIFCSMAGIFSERSGIIDISLEGKMLMSAFVAATFVSLFGSPIIGLISAIIASVFLSLIHGFACISNKGNQVVSGLAINILASGLTVTVGFAIFARGGQTPFLSADQRFQSINLPFVEIFEKIPLFGVIYKEIFSGHNFFVWLCFFVVILTYYIIYKTKFGLRIRAVGEKPEALDTAGVSVILLRYQSVVIAGILCGIAGAYLSIGHGAGFVRDMTAGKGYIALAAMIFGNWKPMNAMIACLLFGFLDALAARLQGISLPVIGEVPTDLILVLPYLVTVILLAGFIGKSTPPSAIGIPYNKESR